MPKRHASAESFGPLHSPVHFNRFSAGSRAWPGQTPGVMEHSPNFLRLVNDAKSRIREVNVDQLRQMMRRDPPPVLLDVREDHEWLNGHAEGARHMGKGILERDIERLFPDFDTEMVMYCGGGFRSALTCDAAQRMGYRRVYSLAGGFKALVAAGWPIVRPVASPGAP